MTRVKICGITTVEDARRAAYAGADAIGLVFADSPRRVDAERAGRIVASLPAFVTPVAVFVDEPVESIVELVRTVGIGTVQIHGRLTNEMIDSLRPLKVIQGIRVGSAADLGGLDDSRADAFLLDARVQGKMGGTGQTFDWSLAVAAARRHTVILAGGLTPENVAVAIAQVRPWAVDTSSGVESSPGRKDPAKIEAFLTNARNA